MSIWQSNDDHHEMNRECAAISISMFLLARTAHYVGFYERTEAQIRRSQCHLTLSFTVTFRYNQQTN